MSASTDWAIGAGNGGSNPGNAYQGTKNAYFKVSGFTGGGNTTRLVSPELNLAGYQSTELKFHYTNQLRTLFIFNYQDELKVKYKTSVNGTWQTLATYNSNVANWTEVILTLPKQALLTILLLKRFQTSDMEFVLIALRLQEPALQRQW